MILKNKAFTLIELLIVIAIIAILTVAFLPGALKAPAKARDAGRIKSINDIATTLESFSAEHGGKYPSSIGPTYCLDDTHAGATELQALVSYFANNKFPRDPTSLNSCNSTETVKKTMFLYKYYDGTSGMVSEKFYIVAAKVEVAASSNADLGSLASPKEFKNKTEVQTAVGQGKIGKEWYVVYGPK